jgi:Glyoxalase/Bleomycin resistance protein/Dioxygenase superfamily
MNAGLDLFHVGFVARDIRASMEELSGVLGCRWSDVSEGAMALRHEDEAIHPEMRFAFSLGSDRGQIELIERVPGTVWELPDGTDLQFNHLGYWTDGLAQDSGNLTERGMPLVCTYATAATVDGFAYHRLPSGLVLELVDTDRRPDFDAWFSGADFSTPDAGQ